jgi:hypothetical protein
MPAVVTLELDGFAVDASSAYGFSQERRDLCELCIIEIAQKGSVPKSAEETLRILSNPTNAADLRAAIAEADAGLLEEHGLDVEEPGSDP